jgi:BMFP domain-containing protein YqiC
MWSEPPVPQTLDEATALLRLAWDQLEHLQARVQELEARLGQNSTNS